LHARVERRVVGELERCLTQPAHHAPLAHHLCVDELRVPHVRLQLPPWLLGGCGPLRRFQASGGMFSIRMLPQEHLSAPAAPEADHRFTEGALQVLVRKFVELFDGRFFHLCLGCAMGCSSRMCGRAPNCSTSHCTATAAAAAAAATAVAATAAFFFRTFGIGFFVVATALNTMPAYVPMVVSLRTLPVATPTAWNSAAV
jgi:hypothetical protein